MLRSIYQTFFVNVIPEVHMKSPECSQKGEVTFQVRELSRFHGRGHHIFCKSQNEYVVIRNDKGASEK